MDLQENLAHQIVVGEQRPDRQGHCLGGRVAEKQLCSVAPGGNGAVGAGCDNRALHALDDSRQLRDGFLGQLGFRDVAQQADTLGRLAGNRVGFR